MGAVLDFLYKIWISFVSILCFSLYTCFLRPLFGSHLSRRDESSKEERSENWEVSSMKKGPNQDLRPVIETESKSKQDVRDFTKGLGEKEETGFSFQFKFPSYEEFCKKRSENGDPSYFDEVQSNTTMKYEFAPVKGFNGFIKEPECLSLNDDNGGVLPEAENYLQIDSKAKAVDEELREETEEREKDFDTVEKLQSQEEEIGLHCKNGSSSTNSEPESINSNHLGSIMNQLIDKYNDGFLSVEDFGGEFERENLTHAKGEVYDEMPQSGENKSETNSDDEHEDGELDKEHTYTAEELRKIEETHLKNVHNSESDSHPHGESKKSSKGKSDLHKVVSKTKSGWDSDDDLETLWEHQELIEQLKMELKKVRATGLPTILEESESPKIADDLKPWKIDEKFKKVNRAGELPKFYKSYRDRMRKLDILNYQKMYAVGFLQLKDPLQSISSQKSSVPSASALLLHNLFPSKPRRVGNDPMMKFVMELQSDLEIVYVGHMCLSWEILHWQYGKALDMWESDPRGIRTYNEVAGDFQQFQVLMQRFIEDEPFHGPRVQYYVKNRCMLRNLLQVPLIREDNAKDRKKALKRQEMGDFVITSDMLVEILEESIRIFWRFVRTDKDCSSVTVKSRKGLHIELQDPTDFELLMDVQANLRKKEKKLKDLLRSGNCILKKFRKCQEDDDSDQVLYFFSQVDMKLVGRVLNMPRISTDQLLWCRNKLQKISFASKKIQVEPSFLLFPC